MKLRKVGIGVAVVVLASIFVPAQSLSASELTDAQDRLESLKQSYASDTYLLNVWLPKNEIDAFNCVQEYYWATTELSIANKNLCQASLDSIQADKFNVTRRAIATQNEIAALEAQIELLKSKPPVSADPSPVPEMTTQNSVPNSQTIPSSETPSTSSNEVKSSKATTPSAKPLEKELSHSEFKQPANEKTPSPQPSKSSVVVGGTKVKPSAKKPTRTIKCVKGKTARTISGVSPKCPAGFKRSS